MDIPNLSTETVVLTPPPPKQSPRIIILIIALALTSGFIFSRVFPGTKNIAPSGSDQDSRSTQQSTENITDTKDLKIGQIYGNVDNDKFKDTAVGIVEKGNINGEGTHILNREGGLSQRASLTSSAVDLDLFVGKKVEVKGETNTSNKTSWLLDVGNIKILE